MRPTIARVLLLFVIPLLTLFLALQSTTEANTPSNLYLPSVQNPQLFGTTPTVGTFTDVTTITHAGDERLFVAEKPGRIRVMQADGSLSTFLNIQSRVINARSEQGLLGLAFSPTYSTDRYFYVVYTAHPFDVEASQLTLSRFRTRANNPNEADPASETILFQLTQGSPLHNGGALIFHPFDGELYLGIGDDHNEPNGQYLDNLFGTVVRFDVSDVDNGVPRSVVAHGVRNPWRLAVDPDDGRLFIADVGKSTWEEINVVPHGVETVNLGWPCYEGRDPYLTDYCFNGRTYQFPVFAYPHDGRCSIIGGHIIDDPASNLDGAYLYSDFCTSGVYVLQRVPGEGWQETMLGTLSSFGVTTFGVGADNQIYAGFFSSNQPLDIVTLPQ